MRPILSVLWLAGAVLTGAVADGAKGAVEAPGGVQVLRPWSRPAVAGTNAIGYMVLANHGAAGDALEKVESPLAARVEMHASTMTGGVMSMRQEQAVSVPAGGQVTFGPGAYHLMIIGLTRTLKAGDTVPATLSFASGAKLKVRFAVTSGLPPS